MSTWNSILIMRSVCCAHSIQSCKDNFVEIRSVGIMYEIKLLLKCAQWAQCMMSSCLSKAISNASFSNIKQIGENIGKYELLTTTFTASLFGLI